MKIKLEKNHELWQQQYSQAKAELIKALDANLDNIYHIGSTSISDMLAKPTIDIIAIAHNLDKSTIMQCEKLGYKYSGECFVPASAFLDKKQPFNIHLRIVQKNHSSVQLNLCFQETLMNQPVLHQEYSQLKHILHLEDANNEKVQVSNSTMSVRKYTFAKNSLIKKILEHGGYKNINLSYISHAAEQIAYENLKNESVILSTIDLITHAQSPELYTTLLIYQGTTIIGYIEFNTALATIYTKHILTENLQQELLEQIALYISFHQLINFN